jgi:hypothetical protein
MKNKLYMGDGKGEEALHAAWMEVFSKPISPRQLSKYLSYESGTVIYIGKNPLNQNIYWVSLKDTIPLGKKAMADFLPLVGDSLANWIIVDVREGAKTQ